jgi:predicted Zn finger-like uncharacterized protein
MIVQCENCKTRFRLADERVSDRGSKVRCSKCTHVFVVTRGPAAPAALDLGLAGGLASDLLSPSTNAPTPGSSAPYAQAPSGFGVPPSTTASFGAPFAAPSARPVAAPASFQAPGPYSPGPGYGAGVFPPPPMPPGGAAGYGSAPYAPFASPAPQGAPRGYGAPPSSGSPAMPVPASTGPAPYAPAPTPSGPGLAPMGFGGYAAGLQPGLQPAFQVGGPQPGAQPGRAPPFGAPAQPYAPPSLSYAPAAAPYPPGAAPYPPGAAPYPPGAAPYAPGVFAGGFGPNPTGPKGPSPAPDPSSSALELPGFGTGNFPAIARLEPPAAPAPGEVSQLNPAWLGPAASFVEGLVPRPAPGVGAPAFAAPTPIPPLASDRPAWGPSGALRLDPLRADAPRPEPTTAKVEVLQFPSSRPEPTPRLDGPPARGPREVTRPFEKLKIPDAARPSVLPLPSVPAPANERPSEPSLDAESLLDALNAARSSAPAPLANPFLEGLATADEPPALAPGVRSSVGKVDLQRGLLAPAGAVGTFTNDDKTRFAPDGVAAPAEPKPKRPRGPLVPPGSARLVGWIGALVASVAAMVFWRAFTGDSPISELAVALLPGPSAGQTRAQVLTTDHGTSLVVVRGLADADAKLSGVRVVLRTDTGELARAEAPLGVVYDALELHAVAGAAGLEALRTRPRAPQPPRDGKVPWMVVLPLELGLHQVADVRAELR